VQADKSAYLVRITRDGVIKRTRRTIELKSELGHFYLGKAPWVPGGKTLPRPKIITALGFEYLNTFSPIAWVSSPTIRNSDGKEVGNPDNRIKTDGYVRVTQFGVGRASDGTLRAHDLTLTYDLNAYFAADLYKKFTDKDGKGGEWGEIVNLQAAQEHTKRERNYSYILIGPEIALLFNLKHAVVVALFREHSEQRRFADRLAVSICRRNIYKKHFGFTNCPENGIVTIDCWEQPEVDFESLRNNVVTRNGRIIIDGEEVQVDSTEETATIDDIEASHEDDDDNSRPTVQVDAVHDLEKSRAALRDAIRVAGGKDVAQEILDEVRKRDDRLGGMLVKAGLSTVKGFATCKDTELLDAMAVVYTKHSKGEPDGKPRPATEPGPAAGNQPAV
jgi:hypothetical protein